MRISTSMRWLVVAVSAAMLLAVAAACSSETIEVPGETVVVEKEVIKTVEVPGETVVKEVIKEVQVPGETVVVEKRSSRGDGPRRDRRGGERGRQDRRGPRPDRCERESRRQEVPGKKYVTDPTTGVVTTAPEYGGTLTFARKQIGEHTDTWFISGWAAHFISGVLEKPSIGDWGIDRAVHDWKTTYVPPSTLTAALAESWETPDDKTVILNIRQGCQVAG